VLAAACGRTSGRLGTALPARLVALPPAGPKALQTYDLADVKLPCSSSPCTVSWSGGTSGLGPLNQVLALQVELARPMDSQGAQLPATNDVSFQLTYSLDITLPQSEGAVLVNNVTHSAAISCRKGHAACDAFLAFYQSDLSGGDLAIQLRMYDGAWRARVMARGGCCYFGVLSPMQCGRCNTRSPFRRRTLRQPTSCCCALRGACSADPLRRLGGGVRPAAEAVRDVRAGDLHDVPAGLEVLFHHGALGRWSSLRDASWRWWCKCHDHAACKAVASGRHRQRSHARVLFLLCLQASLLTFAMFSIMLCCGPGAKDEATGGCVPTSMEQRWVSSQPPWPLTLSCCNCSVGVAH